MKDFDGYRYCAVCGRAGTDFMPIHRHHVFGGINRKASERCGMVVDLCCDCHEGPEGVHRNRELDLELKQRFQEAFEESHTREEFRQRFGKSWL